MNNRANAYFKLYYAKINQKFDNNIFITISTTSWENAFAIPPFLPFIRLVNIKIIWIDSSSNSYSWWILFKWAFIKLYFYDLVWNYSLNLFWYTKEYNKVVTKLYRPQFIFK